MKDLLVKLYKVNIHGNIQDMKHEFRLSHLGGMMPRIGDEILDPHILFGKSLHDPKSRTIYKVERVIYNCTDNKHYAGCIVVSSRTADSTEIAIL